MKALFYNGPADGAEFQIPYPPMDVVYIPIMAPVVPLGWQKDPPPPSLGSDCLEVRYRLVHYTQHCASYFWKP